jgi:hypothetical protein
MSRPDLKAGGTKLAVIDHLSLHIYCACGHYADLEVADIIPTMRPEPTSIRSAAFGTKGGLRTFAALSPNVRLECGEL